MFNPHFAEKKTKTQAKLFTKSYTVGKRMGNRVTQIPSQFQLLTACANPDILSRSCAVIEYILILD